MKTVTNTEKLKAVIAYAVKQGFNGGYSSTYEGNDLVKELMRWNNSKLFFNHDFCKKLFGEELLCYDCGEMIKPPMTIKEIVQIGVGQCDCNRQFEHNEPAWQYHIQQLALSDDRIDYCYQWVVKKEATKL